MHRTKIASLAFAATAVIAVTPSGAAAGPGPFSPNGGWAASPGAHGRGWASPHGNWKTTPRAHRSASPNGNWAPR